MWFSELSGGDGSSADGELLCSEVLGISVQCGVSKGGSEVYSAGCCARGGFFGAACLQSGAVYPHRDSGRSGADTCEYPEHPAAGSHQLSGYEIFHYEKRISIFSRPFSDAKIMGGSFFDIRAVREACALVVDIRVARKACRSLFI